MRFLHIGIAESMQGKIAAILDSAVVASDNMPAQTLLLPSSVSDIRVDQTGEVYV